MSLNDRARLDRLFGQRQTLDPTLVGRLRRAMTPEMKAALRRIFEDHEKEIEQYKEALEGHEELKDRLRLTQLALIVALQKMGGAMTLHAGQLNEIPAGSVVKVDKLERGEGDNVPLRVSWRPPTTDKPATTDIRPGS